MAPATVAMVPELVELRTQAARIAAAGWAELATAAAAARVRAVVPAVHTAAALPLRNYRRRLPPVPPPALPGQSHHSQSSAYTD
jgi:hypothetical protein